MKEFLKIVCVPHGVPSSNEYIAHGVYCMVYQVLTTTLHTFALNFADDTKPLKVLEYPNSKLRPPISSIKIFSNVYKCVSLHQTAL